MNTALWTVHIILAVIYAMAGVMKSTQPKEQLSEKLLWAEDFSPLRRGHVEAYVAHLEDAGYAPNTICRRIATVSSFYRWAVAQDHLPSNPVEGARRPRKPTESTWHHTLTLRADTTKGSKAAVIALAPRTVQAVSLARGERRSGALLRSQHGRRMTPYNVQYLVGALFRNIGVARRITRTACGTRRSPSPSTPASACATCRTSPATPTQDHPWLRPLPQPAQPPRHLRHRAVPRRRQLTLAPHAPCVISSAITKGRRCR